MGKRDSLMLSIDDLLCKLINLQVFIKNKFRVNKILKKNKQLIVNDTQSVCFVIGNGPSINQVDFELIKDYPSITVNYFYKGKKDYQSTYHLAIDPAFSSEEHLNSILCLNNTYPRIKILVREDLYKVLMDRKIDLNNFYFLRTDLIHVEGKIKCDICNSITGSINVIPVAIECAIAMGYKRICLLGCDFSLYTKNNGQHFYEEKIQSMNMRDYSVGNLIRCALVHKQHYDLERYSNRKGVKIYNATPESLIEAYEFIDLEEFLIKSAKKEL